MTTPGRTLSMRSGAATPTLDAMRATRASDSWGMATTSRSTMATTPKPVLTPRSISAAFTPRTNLGATLLGTSSTASAVDGLPSAGAEVEATGGKTAQLNFSLLERRIDNLEKGYEQHGAQLRTDLREWFVSSFSNLEQTVTDSLASQQQGLDAQHAHFTERCAQVERKLSAPSRGG
jgi:hypothetical protein